MTSHDVAGNPTPPIRVNLFTTNGIPQPIKFWVYKNVLLLSKRNHACSDILSRTMSVLADGGDQVDYEEEVDLEGEEETLRLFTGLMRKEKPEREAFVQHLAHSVQLWLRKRNDDTAAKKLLSTHMPSILRLSLTCPFEDVREGLGNILQLAKVLRREGVSMIVRMLFCPAAKIAMFFEQ